MIDESQNMNQFVEMYSKSENIFIIPKPIAYSDSQY